MKLQFCNKEVIMNLFQVFRKVALSKENKLWRLNKSHVA